MHSKFKRVLVVSVALSLSGCWVDDDGENRVGSGNPNPNPTPSQNQPPTIAGAPPLNVLEGQPYEFIPNASDPDGDALEFSISRKPAWARFDRASGRIWGTPGAQDVGNFTNVSISVTDGESAANLAAFDISVDQVAAGSATLSWMPPTENADGSPLTDLAGYRIYYGRNQNNLTRVVVLDNPGLTRFVVENLTTARWFFTMTSVNADGVESSRSATASKTIG